MLGTKIALGTGVATALVGIAIAAPGGVAHPLDGRDVARPTATSTSTWRTGLSARSEALNVRYGLGEHERKHLRVSSVAAWHAGMAARSEALNRLYGLGPYA
jgi:hypothetical protein